MRAHVRQPDGTARAATRVLVVDDDSAFAMLLKEALEGEGFAVTTVTDGGRAIETVESAGYDAMIVDRQMSGIDGLDFLSYVRHRRPGTPVILMTAFGGQLVGAAARRRGAQAYLEKPLRLEDLATTVRRVVAEARRPAPDRPAGEQERGPTECRSPLRPPSPTRCGADPLWAVVLAGGRGERLRPLIRRVHGDDRPKQYATLAGTRSLLRQTLDRVALVAPPERTIVVSVAEQRRYLAAEISGPTPQLLLQPEDRGTAAAALLPAFLIAARSPQAAVAVFPSDHFVSGEQKLAEQLRALSAYVQHRPERIVLVGAVATEPETEYGWIEPGELLGLTAAGPIWSVRGFVEKPTEEAARAAVAAGHLWNTLLVVAKAATLVEATRQFLPVLHERLSDLADATGAPDELALRRAYGALPPLNLSTELLEQCTAVLAVSRLSGVTWCDWGTPRRVIRSLQRTGLPVQGLAEWLASGGGDQARARPGGQGR